MDFDLSTDIDNVAYNAYMMESEVELLLDEVRRKYQNHISVQSFEVLMDEHGIIYDFLPAYLRDRLDAVDVY